MSRECKFLGVNLPEKIKTSVSELCNNNSEKVAVMASIAGSESFIEFAKNEGIKFDKSGDLYQSDKNKFKKLLQAEYLKFVKDTHATATKEQGETILGFDSGKAYSEAQLHTAYIIAKFHRENLLKPVDQRKSKDEIIKEVRKQLKRTYLTEVVSSLYNELSATKELKEIAEEFKKRVDDYTNKVNAYNLLNSEYNSLVENYNKQVDEYEVLQDQIRIAEETNSNDIDKLLDNEEQLNDSLDALQERIDELEKSKQELYNELEDTIDENKVLHIGLRNSILSYIDNFINQYGNSKHKNYSNLISLITSDNGKTWFDIVFMNPRLTAIAREYKPTLNNIETAVEAITDLDEEGLTEQEDNSSNGIHDMGWDRDIKSFEKAVDGTIRTYFNNLPKLLYANKVDGKFVYDTNNELGVILPDDGRLLMGYVIKNANTNSLPLFIQSIEQLSKIKGLESLAIFAEDLKNDKTFAKLALVQLRKPAIAKATVNVVNSGITINQSNTNIDAVMVTAMKIVNDFKLTRDTQLDIEDVKTIESYIEELSKKGIIKTQTDKQYILYKNDFAKYRNIITKVLTSICPSITVEQIENVLNNTDSNLSDNYIKMLSLTKEFIKACEQTENRLIIKRNEYNSKYSAYKRMLEVPDPEAQRGLKAPVLDINDSDYSEVWKQASEIASIITKYNITPIQLNSANAAGNMSSNVIHNSRITNLLNMINDYYVNGKNEKVYEQLEILKEEIKDRHFHDYSVIFYGIEGTNIEGLFKRLPNGEVIVNPNAKDVLSFYLFDGALNKSANSSSLYGNMFKGDYFLSMMAAFDNNEDSNTSSLTRDSAIENRAGYFLRVPSDAGKNFIAMFQKIKIGGLQYVSEEELQNYITNVKAQLEHSLRNIETKNNTINKLFHYSQIQNYEFGKENTETNKLSAKECYEFLTTGKINKSKVIKNKNLNYIEDKSKGLGRGTITLYYGEGFDRIEIIVNAAKTPNLSGPPTFTLLNIDKVITARTENELAILPKQLFRDIKDDLKTTALSDESVKLSIEKTHPIIKAFTQHLKRELNIFISQLNVMFDVHGDQTLRTNTDGLFDFMHHNKGKIVSEDGKLLGNAFNFISLKGFEGINIQELIEEALSLYGGDLESLIIKDGDTIKLNLARTDIFDAAVFAETGKLRFKSTKEIESKLSDIISQWLSRYIDFIDAETAQFDEINDGRYNKDKIRECIINTYLVNLMYDDILEGSSKYYKDPQTLLKRAKENQMGGISYSNFDLHNKKQNELYETEENIELDEIDLMFENSFEGYQKTPMKIRNGFRAVTIYNTNKASDNANSIERDIEQSILKKGISAKVAKMIAANTVKPFRAKSCINDAQSFITLPEFIRRREADGTIDQYVDVIAKLINPNVPLSEITVEDMEKIQVNKNVYYDIAYDPITELYYPRQIKNAEFVLIPRLIKGTPLEKLNDLCIKHDIGQINTLETSKAANKNVIEFFDANGVTDEETGYIKINQNFEQDLIADNYKRIETYYYQNLYKQLDVSEHMKDTKNKVGIQMFKKLIDNYHTASPETQANIDKMIEYYVYNIQESFEDMLDDMDWAFVNGKVVNKKNPEDSLNFKEYYNRLKEECARLGLDSNFMDYVTLDETGNPIMPNYMNLISTKFENIIQSIFNSYITRQELPGWHAVQVTSVGVSKKLRYHPEERDANGNIVHQGYIEVLLPRWSKLLPKYKPTDKLSNETQEEYNERIEREREEFDKKLLEQLEDEGLLIQLGYRIPTEGKQSISAIKVVGFVDDSLGSTIILPEEWVAQTGADFDVDSVFNTHHEFYIDAEGKVRKVKFDSGTTEDDYKRRYINYVRRKIKISKRQRVNQDEIEDAITEAKRLLDLSDPINANFGSYSAIKDRIKALRKRFPNSLKNEINQIINNNNKENIDDLVTNQEIIALVQSYIEKETDEDYKALYEEHNANLENVSTYIQLHRDYVDENTFNKRAIADEVIKEARDKYFNGVETAAEKANLLSFEEFKKLPLALQNSREARNNVIVDAMKDIMMHEDSHDEGYSTSTFVDMTEANKTIDKLLERFKVIRNYYDPLDQLQNFENAIYGRQLKALSVTRDNFLSLANKGRLVIPDKYAITVIYDTEETNIDGNKFVDKEIIDECYQKQKKDSKEVIVKHNRFGWSETNRNVTGKLLTPYSSQTSAQSFDIIKEGSIPNINTYTFPVFKTLVDSGMDYYTAILFIRQPGITQIVKAYAETASIFLDKSGNPIDKAIIHYAKQLDSKITDYTPIDQILKKFKLNKEYEDSDLTLNVAGLKQSIVANNPLEQIKIICQFKKLLEFTNKLDKVLKISNPDKFGAKQDIYSTKAILNSIKELRENEPILTTEDGTNVVDALYPLNEDGKSINIKKSFYPSMAAFMQYSTMFSAEINSQIFELENEVYEGIWNQLLQYLNVDGNAKMNKAFKKYIITYAFNSTPMLRYPITITPEGFVGIDMSRIDENDVEGQIVDKERLRIFGYNSGDLVDLKIKDVINPTKEEIEAFNKLTPVEKVLFIQQHFNRANLFSLINVNVFTSSKSDLAGKPPRLTFNDQLIDKESAYNLFRQEFYNKNPLIKLAAIDIIKYAFVVEGYNFKSGNTSKIIPNSAIKNRLEDYGLNLIESVNQTVLDIYLNIDEFVNRFVRSNKQFTKKVFIPKPNKENPNLGNQFETIRNAGKNDFICIEYNKDKIDLLLHLGLIEKEDKTYNDTGIQYITISRYNSSQKKYVDVLYKVETNPNSNNYYLIPLNPLEENETGEYSLNNHNNTYEREESYLGFIDYLESTNTGSFSDYTFNKENVPSVKRINPFGENEAALKATLNGDNVDLRNGAKKLYDGIVKYYESDTELKTTYYQVNNNESLRKLKFNGETIQEVTINGVTTRVAIRKTNAKIFKRIMKYVGFSDLIINDELFTNPMTTNGNPQRKLAELVKAIPVGQKEAFVDVLKYFKQFPNANYKNITIYRIDNVNDGEVEYESTNEMESAYGTIDSSPVEGMAVKAKEVLAQRIYNALKAGVDLEKYSTERYILPLNMKGVNPKSSESIRNNLTEIYKTGLKYYQNKARLLKEEAEKFEVSNGEIFSINDPALYEYLLNTKNEKDINKLIKLILESLNFGKDIYDIYNLNVEGETEDITQTIEALKQTISSIKDNVNVKYASDKLINDVFGKELATNPLVKEGLISVTEAFGDINSMTMNLSNIAEIGNKEVQLILKHIYSQLETAKFNIDDALSDWRKRYEEIMKMSGEFNPDKIINDEGVLIREFDSDFLKTKDELNEAIQLAEEKYTRYSKEYELARLEKLEWYAKNVEQEYVKEYYDRYNANLRKILTSIPEYYLKYKALTQELYALSSTFNTITPEDKIRIIEINRELAYMSNPRSISRFNTESEKQEEEYKKTKLKEFIDTRREINKTYFDYVEDELFEEELAKNLRIVEKFDAENKYVDLDIKLQNIEYAKAFNWIQANSYYRIDDEVSKQITKSFAVLKAEDAIRPNRATKTASSYINEIIETAKNDPTRKVIDEYGIFHPERLTEDEIREIKDITEAAYIGEDHALGSAFSAEHENDAYGTLIKDIPANQPVYKSSVYKTLTNLEKFGISKERKTELEGELGVLKKIQNPTAEQKTRIVEIEYELRSQSRANLRRGQIIAKINNLIKYGVVKETGHISSKLLFENLTYEQKQELASLYEELKEFDIDAKKDRTSRLHKHKKSGLYIGTKPNKKAFEEELDYYHQHLANTAEGALWKRIFTEDHTDDDKSLRPNIDIYGYMIITNEKGLAINKEAAEVLIDKEKTEAKKFIRENLVYETVPGYDIARMKAISEGRFNEWFKDNHYYNPITHKIEPLRIWTTMKLNPNGPSANKAGYVQKDSILTKDIKDEYRNTKFKPEAKRRYTQYNKDTGEYRNEKYNTLSPKEKAMVEFLEDTMYKYGKSKEAKIFFGKGYIPRLRKKVPLDGKYFAKQAMGIVGLEIAQTNDEWKDEISYNDDRDADFNMARLLKGKGTLREKEYLTHSDYETQEEYDRIEEENKKIREENKKIRENNLKIDNDLLERDIKSIFETFISQSIVYNTKADLRNLGYLVQEDLMRSKGYKKSRFTGDLIKDNKLSTDTRNEYLSEDLRNTLDLFNNWFRRFYYDQYKKGGNLSNIASLLQNMTSAKYMILNVTGGVANVGTGLVNIMGEAFAREYFNAKDFAVAQALYFKSLPYILGNMYSDTSNDLVTCLIKKFNVVNFEEMLERRSGEDLHETVKHFRDMLYGLQAGGEHYMQNTALIAMLKSHRVVKVNGKYEIYTYTRYMNDIERITLESIIKNNENVKLKFEAFKNRIKADAKLRYKYDTLRSNYVVDFIKEYTKENGENKLLDKYVSEKKKLLKEAEADFLKNPTLFDQFEVRNGKAVLKSDSKVTQDMLGQFKVKVLRVNDKIHGNYSKIGAAKIEAEWYGGLLMQYHKHLEPGIMKRWRWKGQYNELKESFDKGSYISLAQFVGIEFKGIANRIKEDTEEKKQLYVLASLQEIGKALIDTVTHLNMNWQLLPEWEKNNIKRAYGDLCGIGASIALTIAIHMATDDDEIKDSNTLSTLVYLADRLYSESRMYTPLGLYSEGTTLWSSPIAARNGVGDLLKLLSITTNMMFNEEFNPEYTTGLYKGQNKAFVLLKRNIPAYRVYDRLQHMSRNNQYYRINDNSQNIKFAKNIADVLTSEK